MAAARNWHTPVPAHASHSGTSPRTCARQYSTRALTTSAISGCTPNGAATRYSTPGCRDAACSASSGMSWFQCFPGSRKYGWMTTIVAPRSTQRSKAVAMDGSASSMCAGSTMS